MSYKVLCDNEELALSETQLSRIKEICEKDSLAILATKKLKEIKREKFLIKDYQRGYRWTELEVKELLNDILEISDEEIGYCLQPLVVKKVDTQCKSERELIKEDKMFKKTDSFPKGGYELLDGQQRLTTIWLILKILNEEQYSIFYEGERPIDEYYVTKAYETIKTWFEEKHEFNINLTNKGKLKKGKSFEWNEENMDAFKSKMEKLFFIWYEVIDNNISSEKVFKNINEGKIELTNAELFKALLLNTDEKTLEEKMKLQRIAFEWDRIENSLRDDDFWYFISKEDVEKTAQKTRIDYIVEVYARQINEEKKYGFSTDKDRFSFLVIQRFIEEKKRTKGEEKSALNQIWEKIVHVFDKLFSWYKDDELYHTIGFLVASEEINRGSKAVASECISELYKNTCNFTVEKTKIHVKSLIKKQLLEWHSPETEIKAETDNIKYEYLQDEEEKVTKTQLKNILLFTSIYPILKTIKDSKKEEKAITRFSFKNFNKIKWDIEHISPRKVEANIGEKCTSYEEFKEKIDELINDIGEENKANKLREYIASADLSKEDYKNVKGYEECCEMWKQHADELSQTPDNSISNLVLLNESINRSYGNAFFNHKRNIIISNDKCGVFIPNCTKNVFLKYYSSSLERPTQWTDEDKNNYKDFIDDMFGYVSGWEEWKTEEK